MTCCHASFTFSTSSYLERPGRAGVELMGRRRRLEKALRKAREALLLRVPAPARTAVATDLRVTVGHEHLPLSPCELPFRRFHQIMSGWLLRLVATRKPIPPRAR